MGIRVLVVDDDKDLLTLIEKFLVKEQPDFEVISTISAQDAVRKLEEEHFDAIVCDYYLGPGEMNGLELLEWLRASHNTMPFIMFTGRSREEVAIRALNLGADLYLKKDQEDLGNLFVELVHHIKSSVESAQIEKTLWEERHKFQKYLDVARVMILALDSDGRVTLMNRRGCEILGCDHDEVIGKDWFKTFLPKRLRKETYDLFRSLTKGKVGSAGYSENLVLTKDGKEQIIAWHYTVLTDESGMITGTLSSGEDITERKEAEEALRQSEQRYHDLLMTLPEGVGITDLDENFTYVNKALSDMLGYPVEELVQKNVLDLTPVDNRRMIKAETERRKRNVSSTYELQMIRKDGELGLFEVSTLPQKDNQGNVIGTIGVMSNITERRQAEEALRDSESMFRSLFEQAPMGVAQVDLDGIILQGNRSLALMLGYDTDELVGINVYDISIPEDEKVERQLTQELLQGTRDSYEMEKRFIRKDGEQIWGILSVSVVSNSRGEPIFTIGMVENITLRKKGEEALRDSQQLLKGTFDSLSDAILVLATDTAETANVAEIIDCNPAAETIFGYSRHELLGQKISMLHCDETEYKVFRESLFLAVEEKGFLDQFEFKMKRKDGTVFSTEHNITPLKNEQGTRIGWVSVVCDITGRLRAEEALKESEARRRSITEHSPDHIMLLDLEGNIQFINRTVPDLTIEEVIGQSSLNFTPPENHEAIKECLKRVAQTGKPDIYYTEYRTKDGKIRHFEVRIGPVVQNDEVVALVSSSTDITNRKRVQDSLIESEEQYRALYDNLSDALIRMDTKGVITFCNAQATELSQYAYEEFIGVNFNELLHPDDRERIAKALTYALETEETSPEGYEVRMIRKDGSVLYVHTKSTMLTKDGKPSGFQSLFHDITERKIAQEALRESEALLKTTGQMAKVGGWVLDANTQEVSWTKETYRIHEVPLDQKPHLEDAINFFHPDEREKLATATQRALDHGEPYDMELRFITAKGKELWTHTICKPRVIKGKTVKLMGTFQDITERKKVEEALRESAVRFRGLFEKSPIGIELYDVEGQLVDANQATLDIFGISSIDGIKGFKLFEDPNLTDEVKDNLRRGESMTYQTAFDFELVKERKLYKTSKSGTIHLDLMISPMILGGGDQTDAYIVHVRDITTLKESEENLKQSEEKYHSLFDNTPVGLTFQEIVVDENGKPIDFIFIDVNEGFEALMGLKKDDIVGKSASHVLTSIGKPGLDWIDVYGKVALTGARARFDHYSKALGRWFSVTAYSPEKNFFITAYTDITEQKKAYEDLKQQRKELSDFAHMMSHDLNSYFFKIRGSILLLGTKDELPEIRGIKLLTEEMIDLVQHSVALADAGLVIDKKHKVSLDHLVRDIAIRHLPEGIALVQGPLLSVMADEIKLIQIFQNLFANAVEHGSPKTVEVRRYDSMDGVRIVVANDGRQIPNDSRPKFFQSGFTTKGKRRGFGLSIVKKLVEAHGWQIKLVDAPETAFEILIPRAAG